MKTALEKRLVATRHSFVFVAIAQPNDIYVSSDASSPRPQADVKV